MSTAPQTSAAVEIRPRDYAFGRERPHARWWNGGDPIATAFYNALSITFPQGERFFMDSVRRYRERVSGPLKLQVQGFIGQEALHTREHLAFNGQVAGHGYDVKAMDARTKAMLDFARGRPPLFQLAVTVALEHFTAILANAILSDPRHLEHADSESRRLWMWHALEEVEHKGVANDVWNEMAATLPPIRRWLIRSNVMLATTALFARAIALNTADLLRQDGVSLRRASPAILKFLLLRPGVLRSVLRQYAGFFRPGFHPWDHDDRALLAQTEAALAG